jgi:hypothetical protein
VERNGDEGVKKRDGGRDKGREMEMEERRRGCW